MRLRSPSRKQKKIVDPSRLTPEVLVARAALANGKDIDRAVAAAKADPDGWRKKTHRQRHRILSKVALELRKARGDLVGTAAANTGLENTYLSCHTEHVRNGKDPALK